MRCIISSFLLGDLVHATLPSAWWEGGGSGKCSPTTSYGGEFRYQTPTGSDLGQVASLKPLYKVGIIVISAS